MNTQRKPSEILRAIGERIAKPEAWTTRTAARDEAGNEVPSGSPHAVCWCWAGAYCREVPRSLEQAVGGRVQLYMHRAIDTDEVGEWNDTHTHAEVLAANARAIELAEEAGE